MIFIYNGKKIINKTIIIKKMKVTAPYIMIFFILNKESNLI